jgi:hypothetical protein
MTRHSLALLRMGHSRRRAQCPARDFALIQRKAGVAHSG